MEHNLKIEKLRIQDLHFLTELFNYNNAEEMILQCTRDITEKKIDIFVLYCCDILIGELRIKYESDDKNYTLPGKRVYLYAFRIREGYRNRGYGTYFLKKVLQILAENNYSEFTVGVEDDNSVAIHIYQKLGFNKLLLRRKKEYQGNAYEYNLYLKEEGA